MEKNSDPYLALLESQGNTRRAARHEESNLQRQCVAWFRLQYPKHARMLFAVPNGGGRSRVEAAIMKAEGVTAGVADLLLLEARGGWGCLCIEMKTTSKSSRQSDNQKTWQRETEAVGNRYEVVRTLERFQLIVRDYMSKPAGAFGRVYVYEEDIAPALNAKSTE